jgi:hypothetical protein
VSERAARPGDVGGNLDDDGLDPGQDGVAGIRVEQEVPDIRIYRVYRVKLNKATGDLDLIRAAGRWNPVNVGKASCWSPKTCAKSGGQKRCAQAQPNDQL